MSENRKQAETGKQPEGAKPPEEHKRSEGAKPAKGPKQMEGAKRPEGPKQVEKGMTSEEPRQSVEPKQSEQTRHPVGSGLPEDIRRKENPDKVEEQIQIIKRKRRIMLTVAYDGTNYCGWQVQPNGDTIEANLNKHLSQLLGEEIHVLGASRTDSGVHAKGNVAVFDTVARMPADKIALAMNTRLPSDIKVQRSCEVPLTFHPRYQRVIKTYEYRISNRKIPDPCQRLYALFYYWDLDESKMQQAAGHLVGTHDFSSFCTHKPEIRDYTRIIYDLTVERNGDQITVRITGNGFLYNMVRIIVGTLLRVGTGMIAPEQVQEILEAKDRSMACETARPEGLTLVSIEYPDAQFLLENPGNV